MTTQITPDQMDARIVRYGDMKPCKTAFIDAHTPGSDQKENFTIIGAGVSESPDQHVHIKETPGFNIGAAGQPPKVRNSLHVHRTAEVFFVLKGRWRFFWGRWGTAGEVILNEGDIFNIPTGIFRGFENVGTDYGMLMAILGGDDAGGGVVWAPQVIEDAREHGLILGANGRLYNTSAGQNLPDGIKPMAVLDDAALAAIPEPTTSEVVPRYIARFWDLMALSNTQPADVISAQGALRDKPGFEVDFISRNSLAPTPYQTPRHEILMPLHGHWRMAWQDGEAILNAGDTCAVPPNLPHSITPAVSGAAAMYRVRNTDDKPGATWIP